MKEIKSSAIALYSGGWGAEDKDELISEYSLTEEEVNEVCNYLADLEEFYEIPF